MSAQIPSITITSIDTTSEEITSKVCSLETDTFPEETSSLGAFGPEGDQSTSEVINYEVATGSLQGEGSLFELFGCGDDVF